MGSHRLIEQVAAGLYRIESDLGPRFMCQYLLVGEDATLLVDTGIAGTPTDVLDAIFDELGVAPTLALISHADVDHCGGNLALRSVCPGVLFACHELDRRWIEHNDAMLAENYGWYELYGLGLPADVKQWIAQELGGDCAIDLGLCGGETIRLGRDWRVEVLHLPGHTTGHVGLWDARNGAAIIIDAVLESALYDRAGNRLIPPRIYDLEAYRGTIRRLRALDPDLLLTAHYPVMTRGDARDFLDRSVAFTHDLEGAVRAAMAAGSTGLAELTRRVAEQVGGYPEQSVAELGASVRACLA